MDFLPVLMVIGDRNCLVVGGGKVARRKVELLLRAGARVTVAAPALEPTLAETAGAKRIVHLNDNFNPSMLEGKILVVSATGNKEVNRQVAEAARQAHLPVNVVDDSELSSFIFPAIVDRSPVLIAVSSGGKSPVLARLLKARLESLVPAAYGGLARLAGEFRERVKRTVADRDSRRNFWERSLQGNVARLFLAGREEEARNALEQALDAGMDQPPPAGFVTMMQADPQDPELLTLKALRHLQEADVIVHDRPVLRETLEMARREAERILVGKEQGQLSCPLREIPSLLVRLAKEGRHVVRLKVGESDAEGGNQAEIDTLAENDIHFQIIPGVAAKAG